MNIYEQTLARNLSPENGTQVIDGFSLDKQ